MRYKIWRKNTKPETKILETNDRAEMVRTVMALILEGETHENIRVEEDKSMPEPDMGSFFY